MTCQDCGGVLVECPCCGMRSNMTGSHRQSMKDRPPEGWILRDGTFVEVEYSHHAGMAEQILTRMGVAYTDAEQTVDRIGWVRVGHVPWEPYKPAFLYEGRLPPSNAQLNTLWDHCQKWELPHLSLAQLWIEEYGRTAPKAKLTVPSRGSSGG